MNTGAYVLLFTIVLTMGFAITYTHTEVLSTRSSSVDDMFDNLYKKQATELSLLDMAHNSSGIYLYLMNSGQESLDPSSFSIIIDDPMGPEYDLEVLESPLLFDPGERINLTIPGKYDNGTLFVTAENGFSLEIEYETGETEILPELFSLQYSDNTRKIVSSDFTPEFSQLVHIYDATLVIEHHYVINGTVSVYEDGKLGELSDYSSDDIDEFSVFGTDVFFEVSGEREFDMIKIQGNMTLFSTS